jgi:disulfide bond formation protein DsbB
MTASTQSASRDARIALLLALAMIAVAGSALGFQHIGGYIPCKLCLQQREPYYAAIPLLGLAALAGWSGAPRCLTRGLLGIGGLLMAFALVLGVYHSGVEWHWWAGPTDCGAVAGGTVETAKDLLATIDATRPPSCDEAAGRFLGISFANAQVIASAALAAFAARALRR